jgi:hypothetical protein
MIEVTFYRRGHANNSSSTHSLITVDEINNIKTDEYKDFGWNHFTAANRGAKFNYLTLCLYNSWINLSSGFEHPNVGYSEYNKFMINQFLNKLKSYFDFDYQKLGEVLTEGSVDHQSVFCFPCYRNKDAGINWPFACDVYKEILENNYVFLGGNDNADIDHPLKDMDNSQKIFFKEMWRNLTDTYGNILCEKDHKTGEWIISKSGCLLKVKFV